MLTFPRFFSGASIAVLLLSGGPTTAAALPSPIESSLGPTPRAAADDGWLMPFTDDATLAVVVMDASKVDPGIFIECMGKTLAGMKDSKSVYQPAQWIAARTMLGAWRSSFVQAGGTHIAAVVSFRTYGDVPLYLIAPVGSGDAARIAAAIKMLPGLASWESEVIDGVVFVGDPSQRKRPLGAKDSAHLGQALGTQAASDIRIALAPAAFVQRAMDETMPRLPEELGGGSSRALSEGMRWSVADFSATETGIRLNVIGQSASPAAALAFGEFVDVCLRKAGEAGLTAKAAQLLKPSIEGQTFRISLDENAVRDVAEGVLPMASAARMNAESTVVASQIRQALMACVVWASDRNGEWPSELDQTVKASLLSAEVLAPTEAGGTIVYRKPSKEEWTNAPSTTAVMYSTGTRPDGSVWVGFADGHVELVDAERFGKLFPK